MHLSETHYYYTSMWVIWFKAKCTQILILGTYYAPCMLISFPYSKRELH